MVILLIKNFQIGDFQKTPKFSTKSNFNVSGEMTLAPPDDELELIRIMNGDNGNILHFSQGACAQRHPDRPTDPVARTLRSGQSSAWFSLCARNPYDYRPERVDQDLDLRSYKVLLYNVNLKYENIVQLYRRLSVTVKVRQVFAKTILTNFFAQFVNKNSNFFFKCRIT